MELLEILSAVSVINRDDGRRFTETGRLDAITALLWDSKYRRINADGLFALYAAKPLTEYKGTDVVVVTSHVDCERGITRCFSRREPKGMLKGTYDNAATNAAITFLMLKGSLPDNVIIAFTGDEEVDSDGVAQLIAFLRKHSVNIRKAIVLDVTDMGWKEGADFTVENDFWSGNCGREIIETAQNLPYSWRFVPSDPDDVPAFVPKDVVIYKEAEPDESWRLDDFDVNCCSVCLPVEGKMHDDAGVLAREASFFNYTEALDRIINAAAT